MQKKTQSKKHQGIFQNTGAPKKNTWQYKNNTKQFIPPVFNLGVKQFINRCQTAHGQESHKNNMHIKEVHREKTKKRIQANHAPIIII